MRLDKYLKTSRLIKRRSVANQACDLSRVEVNGKPAKPAKEIKVGDKISIRYGLKALTVEVLSLTPSIKKQDADSMYRIINED